MKSLWYGKIEHDITKSNLKKIERLKLSAVCDSGLEIPRWQYTIAVNQTIDSRNKRENRPLEFGNDLSASDRNHSLNYSQTVDIF
ncbi:MAG TPA: hypothetical protein DCM07_31065, partial [Planctomycetaceae bacterium]|nr:hypothetical protein [Planctomycetaceae bacterium]